MVLREALRQEPRTTPHRIALGETATFLHVMRRAALQADPVSHLPFTHCGQVYSLETRRNPERAGEVFGAIHASDGANSAEFRAFYAAGDPSGIPIRIEYRARSFLRLTFEAEPGAERLPIPSLFSEESA